VSLMDWYWSMEQSMKRQAQQMSLDLSGERGIETGQQGGSHDGEMVRQMEAILAPYLLLPGASRSGGLQLPWDVGRPQQQGVTSQLSWLLHGACVSVPDVNELLTQCLLPIIQQRVDDIGQQLLGCLLSELGLMSELVRLRNVFLLGSPAVQTWADELLGELLAGNELRAGALESALQEALTAAGPEDQLPPGDCISVILDRRAVNQARSKHQAGAQQPNAPKDNTAAAAAAAAGNKGGEEQPQGSGVGGSPELAIFDLEGVKLQYQPSWLLSSIGGDEAMACYNQALIFMLQIRLTKMALDRTRSSMIKMYQTFASARSAAGAAAAGVPSCLASAVSTFPEHSKGPGAAEVVHSMCRVMLGHMFGTHSATVAYMRPAVAGPPGAGGPYGPIGSGSPAQRKHQRHISSGGAPVTGSVPIGRGPGYGSILSGVGAGASGAAGRPGAGSGAGTGGSGAELLDLKEDELLVMEMSHFVNSLQQFVVDRLLYGAWMKLEQNLDQAGSLDEVTSLHHRFLADLEHQTIRREHKEYKPYSSNHTTHAFLNLAVVKALNSIVQYCTARAAALNAARTAAVAEANVQAAMSSGPNQAGAVLGTRSSLQRAQHMKEQVLGARHKMADAAANFRNSINRYYRIIYMRTTKLGRGTEVEHLVMRLNYNGFYKQSDFEN